MSEAFSLLDVAPVMPVVVIDDAADAVLLARALVSGGIPVVEFDPPHTGSPRRHPRHQR